MGGISNSLVSHCRLRLISTQLCQCNHWLFSMKSTVLPPSVLPSAVSAFSLFLHFIHSLLPYCTIFFLPIISCSLNFAVSLFPPRSFSLSPCVSLFPPLSFSLSPCVSCSLTLLPCFWKAVGWSGLLLAHWEENESHYFSMRTQVLSVLPLSTDCGKQLHWK